MARLAGASAAVYVDSSGGAHLGTFVKILDVSDWEWHDECSMDRITIKGDRLEQFTPGAQTATFTAKRFHEGIQVFQGYVSDAANNGTEWNWRLDLVDNTNTFTQIFCSGYGRRSTTSAPQAGVVETFELQVTDTFSFSM